MNSPAYDTGCSCDGTCTDCAQDMRADLDNIVAVLDLDARGLAVVGLAPGSAAARVAAALAAKTDASA